MGWGPIGLEYELSWADVTVIIDTISFSTAVDIATSRGAAVYPFLWTHEEAAKFAQEIGAELALGFSPEKYSLSPRSLLSIPAGTRLVLPSPNGSALSSATGACTTLTGCFRNATSVGKAAGDLGRRILVIAAGEKWPDSSLRPALEDYLAAGAIISSLGGEKSAEALTAEAAFQASRKNLPGLIRTSFSGYELTAKGRAADLDLACELDISTAAPILVEGAFVDRNT